MLTKYKTLVHNGFEIGIFLKGLNGILEILGGGAMLILSPQTIFRFIFFIVQSLPQNLVGKHLLVQSYSLLNEQKTFLILFLLSHGIIKLLLIFALYKKKLWAYPLAVLVFGLFILFQMEQYFVSRSLWLIILSVLDVLVIGLTYLEYRNLKSKINGH